MFLEILQNSQENTCARSSFLIKLQADARNFIRNEALAQVFSCEFCEISKNTSFKEHLQTTASVSSYISLFIELAGFSEILKISIVSQILAS